MGQYIYFLKYIFTGFFVDLSGHLDHVEDVVTGITSGFSEFEFQKQKQLKIKTLKNPTILPAHFIQIIKVIDIFIETGTKAIKRIALFERFKFKSMNA